MSIATSSVSAVVCVATTRPASPRLSPTSSNGRRGVCTASGVDGIETAHAAGSRSADSVCRLAITPNAMKSRFDPLSRLSDLGLKGCPLPTLEFGFDGLADEGGAEVFAHKFVNLGDLLRRDAQHESAAVNGFRASPF